MNQVIIVMLAIVIIIILALNSSYYQGFTVDLNDDYMDSVDDAAVVSGKNASYDEELSLYNEKIKRDMLNESGDIEEKHNEFAMSIKPITNQPSRNVLRDDDLSPVPWVGFNRANSVLNINRSLPNNSIPSQLLEDMNYRNTIGINYQSSDIQDLLRYVPKEAY